MDTLNRIKSIEEGMRKEMVRKGTDTLCEKNESEDLDRIRRVASSGFVPFSPLDAEYFKKHGEWQDISLLIEVLGRSDGSLSLLGGLFDAFAALNVARLRGGRNPSRLSCSAIRAPVHPASRNSTMRSRSTPY